MNCRDTAAVAMLAWYLLVPPSIETGTKPNAPLKNWSIQKTFNTASECEDERKLLIETSNDASEKAGVDAIRRKAAKCIAATDPRLK